MLDLILGIGRGLEHGALRHQAVRSAGVSGADGDEEEKVRRI